jgi:hypothetical protein
MNMNKINSGRISFTHVKTAAAAIIVAAGLAGGAVAQEAQQVTAADTEQALQNLQLFDDLDFKAWNGRDWDLFRKLHAPTVKVGGFGQQTEGIDDHLAWAQAFIAQVPDSKIDEHPIRIGAGDWTAVTGTSGGTTSATIARWENGQIVEEYLFQLVTGQ